MDTLLSCIDISEPVLYISSGDFTAGKHWKHKPMYHDGNFEIIIMLNGVINLQVDEEHYIVHKDEIFALPPYHHLRGFKESPDKTQYLWFHFFPKPDGLKIVNSHDNEARSPESLFNRHQAVLPLLFKLPSMEREIMLANQILDVSKNHYFTSMGEDYLLTTLIIQLSEDYLKSINHPSEEESRIDTIKAWIRANLSENLRVSDVAAAFSLNPHYLARIFKQQTNTTVVQYIKELKIQEAAGLLLRTNLPIKQIANLSFYADEKRFMKAFKENIHVTPSEFRNAYTKKFLDSSSFDPEVPITKNTDRYKERFQNKADH